ncbi:MAG: hypothetical protein KY468_18630, partial [Armatimonadetes bacterium]|nr:hypothetical protein [Armatimonadota bacterium]
IAFASPPPRPDQGVKARAERLLKAQAQEDLYEKVNWAKRIKLGDPHKYILPIIAAKLRFNPNDKEALDAYRAMIEVDKQKIKGDRGLYHFSAIYKGRIFFGYKDVLPTDILAWFNENEGGHLDLFRRGGTENHGMMSRTTGYLFAEQFQKERTGDLKTDPHAYFLDFLRKECKKLYTIGQGEWDSSTYVAFSAAGWLNLYDYAKDPKVRDLARAALDWYSAAYALKYFHGLHSGVESRGFSHTPLSGQTDVLGWLWWNDLPKGFEPDLSPKEGQVRHAINAALSGYRPDPIVSALAKKEVKLPFEARASKPVYYGYTESNVYQEYEYFTDSFTMSVLYNPTPGDKVVGEIWPQTTMFKLALLLPGTARVMGAANGYHRHFPVEGRSPYDQYHAHKGAMVNLCYVPDPNADRRAAQRSLLAVPAELPPPVVRDGWYVFEAGETFVAARPLGTNTRWTDLADWSRRTSDDPDGKVETKVYPDYKWLQTDGKLSGWIIDTGRKKEYGTLSRFIDALREKTRLDLSQMESDRTVTYRSLYGNTLKLRHPGGLGGKPDAWTNGRKLVFENWPVYESPYINEPLNRGILTVNDGQRRMTVDFSGEWPVWKYDRVSKP